MIQQALTAVIRSVSQSISVVISTVCRPLSGAAPAQPLNLNQKKKAIVLTVCSLIIAGSLLSLYLQYRPPTVRSNPKPVQALGKILAGETSRLLQGRGKVVLVTTATASIAQDAFRAALPAGGDIRIIATETIALAGNAVPDAIPGLTPAQLAALLKKHSTADAFVVFVNLLPGPASDWPASGARSPKIILASGFSPVVRELLKSQRAALAVIPRIRAQPQTKTPATLEEWFDAYFIRVTPANLHELP
jgi:hypothetical protein